MSSALSKEPQSRRRAVVLWIVAAVLLLAGALGFWVWVEGAERRVVRSLAPAARAELYGREFGAFTELCGRGRRPDALEARCRERAEYLLQFPECDSSCQELTRSHLPKGTR